MTLDGDTARAADLSSAPEQRSRRRAPAEEAGTRTARTRRAPGATRTASAPPSEHATARAGSPDPSAEAGTTPPTDAADAVEAHAAPATQTDSAVEAHPAPSGHATHPADAAVVPLLRELAGLDPSSPSHAALRERIVESQVPLVHHLALRFRGRGEPYDDLVQVGMIGLLNAVDRFDPSRDSFTAFAVPTILGEIRRHFRDRGWALRVPRRLQDLSRRVAESRETLTHALGRSPTVQELAAHLECDVDLVVEALDSSAVYATVPLPSVPDDVQPNLGAVDSGMELVENRETLRPLLERLPARERRILALRFGRGMSQSQIAAEVGVSQMHVSRLLARSLATLRDNLSEGV